MPRDFLWEDEINDIFCEHLKGKGWQIQSQALGQQIGADIIATKNSKKLCVEVKGGGAKNSAHGNAFTRNQCSHNVSIAFATVPRMIERYNADLTGIVLHNDDYHHFFVQEIISYLQKNQIGVWLVSGKKTKSKIETLNEILI